MESGTISSVAVPSVPFLVTEEGQRVSFDEETYICRELTKRLPLDEAFPDEPSSSAALRDAALALLRRNGGGLHVPKRLLPAEIAPGVYVVGQERYDNLTYMIDCGREGIALIDPTYQSEVDRTIEHVERCGRRREEIRWVLNTHCHTDHSMADRKFQEMGAEILIHADDAEHIERGTQVTAHRPVEEDANGARLDSYPADFPPFHRESPSRRWRGASTWRARVPDHSYSRPYPGIGLLLSANRGQQSPLPWRHRPV